MGVEDYVFNLIMVQLVNILLVVVHQFPKSMLSLIEVSGNDVALLLEAQSEYGAENKIALLLLLCFVWSEVNVTDDNHFMMASLQESARMHVVFTVFGGWNPDSMGGHLPSHSRYLVSSSITVHVPVEIRKVLLQDCLI